MHDDLDRRLRSGTADFAASVAPPGPDAVRVRGNQRRRRKAVFGSVLALVIGVCGAGTAYAGVTRATASDQASQAAASAGSASRPGIAAVTDKGALVVLSPVTGEATRILVAGGVVGGAIAVAPDRSTVYFAARNGCAEEIESVPLAGGTPTRIAPGELPAISPDGTRLAFTREPFSGGQDPADFRNGCRSGSATATGFAVVVRDLGSGGQRTYPEPPGSTQPYPVSALSWSPDSQHLLISVGPSQDNEGWYLAVLDPLTASYLTESGTATIPLTGVNPGRSYYRDGVYLPDGNLFVNQVCCSGRPGRVTSSLLREVSPDGRLIRQVAIGFTDRDHTSLEVDPSGHWLLYLSGQDLFLSPDGTAPFLLTPGLISAAWI